MVMILAGFLFLFTFKDWRLVSTVLVGLVKQKEGFLLDDGA